MRKNKIEQTIIGQWFTKLSDFRQTHERLVRLVLFLAVAVIPLLGIKSSAIRILCRILMYCTLAGSLNVINGYTGQGCIGYAGFFAVGAYSMAILATRASFSFWIILPLAGIMTALVGALICLPTLKMKGIYLSLITLGASEAIRIIALNWTSLTGGPYGIKNIPRPMLGSMIINSPEMFYYLFLAIGILFLFTTHRVLQSRVGRAWLSIREDELAARSLGVNLKAFKITNFAYATFWAGVAGAAYAAYLQYIDSSAFNTDEGFNILSMVIIGGQGTLVGPLVGSVIVNVLTEALRGIGQWRYVAYGILIIAMMWWRPQGLMGASNSVLAGRKKLGAATEKAKKGEST